MCMCSDMQITHNKVNIDMIINPCEFLYDVTVDVELYSIRTQSCNTVLNTVYNSMDMA